jgi:hypothetical protein
LVSTSFPFDVHRGGEVRSVAREVTGNRRSRQWLERRSMAR